jgi:hypothetical protein
MAEISIKVYNEPILMKQKKQFLVLGGAIVAVYGICLLSSAPNLSAQAIQNPVGGVQPQSTQTQNSANTQNQVGTLQDNPGQSLLNQSGNQSLSAVSSPTQTTPDVVVAPSSTLKTEVTKDNKPSLLPYVAIGSFVVAVIGFFALKQEPSQTAATITATESEPVVRPEPLKPPKKAKKLKKRRRKPHQR